MNEVKLSKLIAPAFYEVHKHVQNEKYTHYFLKGGRGSTKSSFVSLEIIYGMMKNPERHCVALRKVASNLRDSVYMQLKWAIEMLGADGEWEEKPSVPEIIYKKTGQRIIFKGTDDPRKIKSIKVSKGYIGYVWFEEADQFSGMEEIRSINQSLLRGGEHYTVFYSYNPPVSVKNWINLEACEPMKERFVHHSSYLDVPKAWLGSSFFTEAEHIKRTREKIYRHEYLGEATGTGGEVFDNVTARKITNEEKSGFGKFRAGVDFGYVTDPFVYVVCVFEKRKLYILDEIFKTGLSNEAAAELILKKEHGSLIVCDSAEPKSIRKLREFGLRVTGAKKGPDSIRYGIKFLQSLDEIIIDSENCPNTAREFLTYEIEQDGFGNLRAEFPDKDNHTIDAVRYALESEINNKKARVIERSVIT